MDTSTVAVIAILLCTISACIIANKNKNDKDEK